MEHQSIAQAPTNLAGRERNTQASQEFELQQKVTTTMSSSSAADSLPEEVWLTLFEKLKPSDKLSCYRTTPKWRNYLSHKRNLLLFPEVLALVRDGLPPNDLLKLRLACKGWKDDFDCAPSPSNHIIEFNSTLDIQRFMAEMESNPGNPFPQRSIRLNYFPEQLLDGELAEDYITRVIVSQLLFLLHMEGLLLESGVHVWTACLCADHIASQYGATIVSSLELFVGAFMHFLPELKRLKLISNVTTEDHQLLQILNDERTIFPQLTHLEEVETNENVPDALVDIFLRSYCVPDVVKKLTLKHGFHDALYGFRNLEELEAQVFVEDLERFRNNISVAPLKKVNLGVYSMEGRKGVDVEKLFSVLELFEETLTHVELEGFPALKMGDDGASKAFRIRLPKLTHLKLRDYDGPLDPLRGLKSLSHLDILNLNFVSRIWQSNIWSCIPSLDWLHYNVTTVNGHFMWSGYRSDIFISDEKNFRKGWLWFQAKNKLSI